MVVQKRESRLLPTFMKSPGSYPGLFFCAGKVGKRSFGAPVSKIATALNLQVGGADFIILITIEFSRFRIMYLLILKAFIVGPARNYHTRCV